jgi:hypothetical protein
VNPTRRSSTRKATTLHLFGVLVRGEYRIKDLSDGPVIDVHVYDAPSRAGSSARISLFDRARRRSLRPLPVAIVTWRLHRRFYENFPHALSVAHQMIMLPPRMTTANESHA